MRDLTPEQHKTKVQAELKAIREHLDKANREYRDRWTRAFLRNGGLI